MPGRGRRAERAVVPFPGKRSQKRIRHEKQRWFRRGRAWRAGGEARIARLKHRFGMARSRYRGSTGTARTAYWAGIANNLVAIGDPVERADSTSSIIELFKVSAYPFEPQ